jgi:hypothetical protein
MFEAVILFELCILMTVATMWVLDKIVAMLIKRWFKKE